MKILSALILSLLLSSHSIAQLDANDVIKKIETSQQSIKTLRYRLSRTDTLLSGDTRQIRGRAWIMKDTSDNSFGFRFCGQREGINERTIYDGRHTYEVFDNDKTYDLQTNPANFSHALGFPGGQIILKDLIYLDTTGTLEAAVFKDGSRIFLRLSLVDLKEYDVINRSKTIEIDPSTWLPAAVRFRQEYLGKVQDLYYRITELHENEPPDGYDFEQMRFLAGYTQRVPEPKTAMPELTGQYAPAFELTAFNNESISSADFKNKAVLLDFWEVWCEPCIASMPKVQRLYDTYKTRGLLVYGIISEQQSLNSAKLLVQKRKISFPMLVGNGQLKSDYDVGAIPRYILIDRAGKIAFISTGYSEKLEDAIGKALGGK